MAGLQRFPDLAEDMRLLFPQVDADKCTLCGDCAKACTVHALQLDEMGRTIVEKAFCVNCASCATACSQDAIRMVEQTCEELVVPDEEAMKRQRAKARASEARKRGRKTLESGLEFLGGMADEADTTPTTKNER